MTAGRLLGLLASAVLVAVLVDWVVLARYLPAVSNALFVRPGIILFNVPIMTFLRVGVLPLLVIPALLVGAFAITDQLRKKRALRKALVRWRNLVLGMLIAPALLLFGGLVYQMAKDSLPGWLTGLVEAFGLQPEFYVADLDHKIMGPLDGSLASLLGLVLGLWIFARFFGDSAG